MLYHIRIFIPMQVFTQNLFRMETGGALGHFCPIFSDFTRFHSSLQIMVIDLSTAGLPAYRDPYKNIPARMGRDI